MNDEFDSMEITQMLRAAGQGDSVARDKLAARVYDDLKRTAKHLMRWEPQQTLQPTALVNEAYLRLFEHADFANSPNRAYFFAAAGQAMRRILVDAARRRKSIKRGGQYQRQFLDDVLDVYETKNIDLINLDEALLQLEELSPRQAKVVHLRWFIDLSIKQVSELLDVSVSTVEQDWRSAKAFLKRQLMFPETT
ncbi:MAG: RNA polymerase sigma factor (TIGR02999 family) [Mariniblastus sp.]|jgi:RNA polymerase sigma factor (TIGR02999 family)